MSELLVSAIPSGTVLAHRFVVRHKIGDGAAASVYRVTDEASGHDVALKILDPLRSSDPVGRMRLLRELEVLSRVSHPAIARCHQLVQHEDLDILVLELIEGETLAARLLRGPLGVAEAVAVVERAAQALGACHAAGVLHRDLKPANIVLHPERGAVLLDFGVAWVSSAANLTRTGAVVGSPRYIAPEVFSSSLPDARADIYALGVIAYEMLAGRAPYLTDSVLGLVEQQRRTDPPSLMSLRPEAGPRLAQVVARAIALLPESRFATTEELRIALAHEAGAPSGRGLAERLPCPECHTPLVLELPFCGGCGRAVSWRLSPGAYAVQLLTVPDPSAAAGWIREKYRYAYDGLDARLVRRLSQVPVPLAVGVSEGSALQLATEARALGMTAEVIQAHTMAGAKLQIAGATFLESVAALALHYGAVSLAAAAGALLGMTLGELASLPLVVGAVGVALARTYVRRPLLRVARDRGAASGGAGAAPVRAAAVRARLERLRHPRARRLAAGALARAAPVLLGDTAGLASAAPHDVQDALERGLIAIEAVDAQLLRLEGRSRARLGAELAAARARSERGVAGAGEEVARLEGEQASLYEAAVAHDLAVREALEATGAITAALGTRTLEVRVTDWAEAERF